MKSLLGLTTFFRENREFLMQLRQAALMVVDAIERGLQISPTTAEIREQWKAAKELPKVTPPSVSNSVEL